VNVEKAVLLVEELRSAIETRAHVLNLSSVPERADHSKTCFASQARLSHLLYMCDEMVRQAWERKFPKFARWLGFADAVYALGFGDLSVKRLSRPMSPKLEVTYRFGLIQGARWMRGVSLEEIRNESYRFCNP
jgi:hypothetical protein